MKTTALHINDFLIAIGTKVDSYNDYESLAKDFSVVYEGGEDAAMYACFEFFGYTPEETKVEKPIEKPVEKRTEKPKSNDEDVIKQLANSLSKYIMPQQTVEIDESKVIELIQKHSVKRIEFAKPDNAVIKLGVQHEMFERVLNNSMLRIHSYLYGPAGTGKSKIPEYVAKSLELNFYSVSVSDMTSVTAFFGYMDATGKYVKTLFREAYENGGVFLIDEIDNGNGNLLTVLNGALSGSCCAFADGMVARHKNFICIATANTFGVGANRMYVGRNQLDASVLNRFSHIAVGYDNKLEAALYGEEFCQPIWELRELYKNERVVISMRNIERYKAYLSIYDKKKAIEYAVTDSIPENLRK